MLRMVIAAAFKAKGRKSMSRSELTYFMSFDLKWFSHDMSKRIVETAIEKGLLVEDGEKLTPAFDISSVEIPVDFKPDASVLEKPSIFDEVVDEIVAKTGMSRSDVIAEINDLQERLESLIDAEVAALVVAKKYGIDVKGYVDEVEKIVLS